MAGKKKAGWLRYVKEAFTYRWNLLFLGGAALGLNAREHDAKALKKAVADFARSAGLTPAIPAAPPPSCARRPSTACCGCS